MATQNTGTISRPTVHRAPTEVGSGPSYTAVKTRFSTARVPVENLPDTDTNRHLSRSQSLMERLSRAIEARISV